MTDKKVSFKNTGSLMTVVGISVKEGQQLTGVEDAPRQFRAGGLLNILSDMGWMIKDLGDVTKESIHDEIEAEV